MKFENDQFHVRSPEEMYAAMPGHEEALATSARIAEMVEENYKSLEPRQAPVPLVPAPRREDARGLPPRALRAGPARALRRRTRRPRPCERLDHELGIINRMGFASYFLIVWDFVRFAREKGIPNSAQRLGLRGPGQLPALPQPRRPARSTTCSSSGSSTRTGPRRPTSTSTSARTGGTRSSSTSASKYGAANVAQIGTFGTMAAKAALKDVGRALNIPLARVDQVTKLIPTRLNITLEEALKEEPALRRLAEEDPEIAELLDFARRLEGTARNVGTHAAGVVIADRPLRDLVPLQKLPNKDKDKEVVSTQWEMGDVEKAGLLKMDFLGLRNLTSLDGRRPADRARRTGQPLDLHQPAPRRRGDLRAPPARRGQGDLPARRRGHPRPAGQDEARPLRRPDRHPRPLPPGPAQRRHGRRVRQRQARPRSRPTIEHPVMKEVLEETYGVMVYQEQVMRILNRLGGIELSQAYACIKAISKKKTEIIAQGREAVRRGGGRARPGRETRPPRSST